MLSFCEVLEQQLTHSEAGQREQLEAAWQPLCLFSHFGSTSVLQCTVTADQSDIL